MLLRKAVDWLLNTSEHSYPTDSVLRYSIENKDIAQKKKGKDKLFMAEVVVHSSKMFGFRQTPKNPYSLLSVEDLLRSRSRQLWGIFSPKVTSSLNYGRLSRES